MRERLVALKLQRDQISKDIEELQNRMASSTPMITQEKVVRVGKLLRDKLAPDRIRTCGLCPSEGSRTEQRPIQV